jgi:hypothetical protein
LPFVYPLIDNGCLAKLLVFIGNYLNATVIAMLNTRTQ